MALITNLSKICPFKLNEIYDTLFELQHRLGLSDDYLLNTRKDEASTGEVSQATLQEYLDASRLARDYLITWNHKQTLVELIVTISLLTAKIKFIEYKLGLCESIDLHQACSLSLVNFSNILADMTVLNVEPTERKTMHKISNEINVPIWLSHYRNQICHVLSDSPCISTLVPLVAVSLTYMKDSFWVKVMRRQAFNAQRCDKLISYVANLTNFSSINQHLQIKKDAELGKNRLKKAKIDLVKGTKACKMLRRNLMQNPSQVADMITNYVVANKPLSKTRNHGLLLEQIILARCFERFVLKLIRLAEKKPDDPAISSWLLLVTNFLDCKRKDHTKRLLMRMNLNASVKIVRLVNIHPIKCCQIAYMITQLNCHALVKKLIFRLRHKLEVILGEKRTKLLIRLNRVAHKSAQSESH